MKLTRLPHRDQKTLKDFEAPHQEEKVFTKKDIGLITFGAVLGVVSGVVEKFYRVLVRPLPPRPRISIV